MVQLRYYSLNSKAPILTLVLKSVTLHTTLGDLKIEIFCEAVPKTAEVGLSLVAFPNFET